MGEYKVRFYINSNNGHVPVLTYINSLDEVVQNKINKYIEYLKMHDGYLDEPYSKHIIGKIRELRVDFSPKRHRIFYFTFIKKQIILLHAFQKKTDKTPKREITIALNNLQDVLNNIQMYE